jgi:hypothetical protein
MNFQGFPIPVLAWALALLPACNPDADDSASPAAPSVPAGLDDSAVLAFHAWSLVGNDLTQGHDELELEVTAPQGATAIQLWIDGAYAGQTPVSGASVAVQGDLGALEAGTHDLVLAADDSDQAFVQLELQRSHPLYVLVTNDWDVSHKEESWLERQEELHANHPAMKMTHFVGPYTFTDPEVSPEHAAELVAWLQGMAADFDDEIGLHVHPYCNFVETTDVPCRHEPSFGYAQDETGYTVELAAYSEDEATTLFEAAKALFESAGIGTPTSFRAGGWTAEIHTLRALDATGFVVDSSGANWPRLEEWEGLEDAGLYEWNQEHWASVGDTSQPWHPNQDEMLSSDEPTLSLLEVPDNGALVDYVDVYEIIEIFEANWPDGAPLAQPVTYVTGYHPVSYDYRNAIALNGGLDHIDQFLASDGAGPVVYETASNMALVW